MLAVKTIYKFSVRANVCVLEFVCASCTFSVALSSVFVWSYFVIVVIVIIMREKKSCGFGW